VQANAGLQQRRLSILLSRMCNELK